jgi:hypothetical protein
VPIDEQLRSYRRGMHGIVVQGQSGVPLAGEMQVPHRTVGVIK